MLRVRVGVVLAIWPEVLGELGERVDLRNSN